MKSGLEVIFINRLFRIPPSLRLSWRFRLTIAGLTSAQPARPTGLLCGIDATRCARRAPCALPVKTGAGSGLASTGCRGYCMSFCPSLPAPRTGGRLSTWPMASSRPPRAAPPGRPGFRALLLLRRAPRRRRLAPRSRGARPRLYSSSGEVAMKIVGGGSLPALPWSPIDSCPARNCHRCQCAQRCALALALAPCHRRMPGSCRAIGCRP